MARECPKCAAPISSRAKFCPRCGIDLAAAARGELGDILSPRRKAIREVIVGWILFVVGGVLALGGLLFVPGSRGWITFAMGAIAFFVGLGTLVGEGKTKEGAGAIEDKTDRAK